jgi:tartrate/fumarate subfamily iron-sulfur-dependent hydro-lyase beta chain
MRKGSWLMNGITLETPISEKDVRELKVGDMVFIDGRKVHVVPMMVSAMPLLESIERGEPIFDLAGSVIYHCPCGFRKVNSDWELRWVGATTSAMTEPVTPRLIELGARVIMGKGGMGKDTLDAMKRYGAVYLSTVGATSAVLARGVTRVVKMVDPSTWLSELEVKEFGPAIVAMDTHGHNLFEENWVSARQKAAELMEDP